MTRPIRLVLFACLLVAIALAAIPSMLPAPTDTTPAPHWTPDGLTVRGAYHVHSIGSDGTGSLDDIAAAAARAGLQFVIITDHGDGSREPAAPQYRHGVLCIDAVEVSSGGGHVVALGMARSPYPLAGTSRVVLEDVARLGGMAVAAHPGSPRESLRWRDWGLPIDGLEWLNADSEWRDELFGSLGRLLLTYAMRPAETLTATLDRPVGVMAEWDRLTRLRRVVGLAGADAHARFGFRRQTEPLQEGLHLKIPSYEASFRAFGLRVQLDAGLSGDPVRDANDVLARIRWGRTYSVIDGLATPGAFEFTATSGGHSARMGDYLDVAGQVVLHARMAAPANARMVIRRDGELLFDTRDREAHVGVVGEPAAYRVEIVLSGTPGDPPIPWLVSNPIYVGLRAAHEAAGRPGSAPPAGQRTSIATEAWVAEASPGSTSVLTPREVVAGVAAVEWRYALAAGAPAGQYAAVNFPVNGLSGHDRLQVRARANAPMRLWIQLRASKVGSGERWGRSVYLDDEYRGMDVPFTEFEPIGATSDMHPRLEDIDVVLLVVDTVNTRPGGAGVIQLAEIWLGRE